jgi:GntR family transcriptional regulator
MERSVIESGRLPEGITVSIPMSKAERITAGLIEMVRSGDLVPGDAIPSTTQLMALYDCSAQPVRVAVGELTIRGLVRGVAGRRVYVVDPLPQWMLDLKGDEPPAAS